jgi:L-serine dehydratase
MRAANRFLKTIKELGQVTRVSIDLYGSLALTGKGHATDKAVILGLEGETPKGINPEVIEPNLTRIAGEQKLMLDGLYPVPFVEETDLIFHLDRFLPYHPNGLRFTAYRGKEIFEQHVYYSIGGGFVLSHEEAANPSEAEVLSVPFPYRSGNELLDLGKRSGLRIPEMFRANERVRRTDEEIDEDLLQIWDVMQACINRGLQQEGMLPGGLGVRRRASMVYRQLQKRSIQNDPAVIFDWISLYALAVNEENASGGRVVTAPTNGAAGVVPAALKYYTTFTPNPTRQGVIDFMLTAGGIGMLFKWNASISAAEMGCMGEVGVASSMAAAGLTAALGGTNEQIENAAEIGMEHHLGLTCDPVRGLVQIPCVERNTMGTLQAINASRLALLGDGHHRVSLDQVIATMRETGRNMQSIYKETSLGGLAANVPEC